MDKAKATTQINHTNNREWEKQGPEWRAHTELDEKQWLKFKTLFLKMGGVGGTSWEAMIKVQDSILKNEGCTGRQRNGAGRNTSRWKLLVMFQTLMSSQVFITLKIWINERVIQNPMMIMCHESKITVNPLFCTRVPPPIKKWGYLMNRHTEAAAWKANRHVIG